MGKAILIGIVLYAVVAFLDAPPEHFRGNLGYGESHQRVVELQQFLTDQGLYDGPITGNYYEQTAAAVQAFQTREGIEATGYFGGQSRAAANALFPREITWGSIGMLFIAAFVIMIIVSARRTVRTGSYSGGSSSNGRSHSDTSDTSGPSSSWGGHPALNKGASSSRGRTDDVGNTWFKDDAGNSARERVDGFGYRSFTGSSGNEMRERSSDFGVTTFSDHEGNTMRETKDDVGNTYYKDNHGNAVRMTEDSCGNKTYKRE